MKRLMRAIGFVADCCVWAFIAFCLYGIYIGAF